MAPQQSGDPEAKGRWRSDGSGACGRDVCGQTLCHAVLALDPSSPDGRRAAVLLSGYFLEARTAVWTLTRGAQVRVANGLPPVFRGSIGDTITKGKRPVYSGRSMQERPLVPMPRMKRGHRTEYRFLAGGFPFRVRCHRCRHISVFFAPPPEVPNVDKVGNFFGS